ncbi:MAG: ABC transporter permease [Phycisphaerales bacterium]
MPRRHATNTPDSVPAIMAPPITRDNPLTRSAAGIIGMVFLAVMVVACLGTLPWTLASNHGVPRYNAGVPVEGRLPPSWVPPDASDVDRLMQAVRARATNDPDVRAKLELIAADAGLSVDEALDARDGVVYQRLKSLWPSRFLGTDQLGRSLFIRVLTGGGISLGIGIAAALLSVCIGTLYGALAGYAGGKTDALMMRIVDILYGLPYILLVVLLAVAVDAIVENIAYEHVRQKAEQRQAYVDQKVAALGSPPDDETLSAFRSEAMAKIGSGELGEGSQNAINVVTLLVAIGGVSWLTMARVIRGQVLSLKNQPFVEAARAIGAPTRRIFSKHLLPNLVGPIIVYATLAVPQAILQESFLSFLGIGVKPPLPSWGNLAAEGLVELNQYKSHWWLLFFPCLLLGLTLLALNFVGEGLREALDPKRARR